MYNTGDEHVAVAIWGEEDVFHQAKQRGWKITREQAQEILAKMDGDKYDRAVDTAELKCLGEMIGGGEVEL